MRVSSCSSTLINSPADTTPASSPVARGVVAYSLPMAPQQGLMALPVEVMGYLMEKLDPFSLFNLRFTCQQAQQAYQYQYQHKVDERQYHLIMHNISLLKAVLPDEIITAVPAPHTPEWQQLKDQPLNSTLVEGKPPIALLQKLYITAWDLLLQTDLSTKDGPQLMRPLKILVGLSPHISNTREYSQQLFKSFPTELFTALAEVQLDDCLQLVGSHFSYQARAFIIGQELDYRIFLDVWPQIRKKKFPSFLHGVAKHRSTFALEAPLEPLLTRLIPYYDDCNARDDEGSTPLIILSQSKEENTRLISLLWAHTHHHNVNAVNHYGYTALDYAITNHSLSCIQILLRHPQINIKVGKCVKLSTLYFAIEQNEIESLLEVEMDLDTRLAVFTYAVWCQKEEVASRFLRLMDQQEKVSFVNQALVQVMDPYPKSHFYELVTYFLQQGADYNIKNKAGDTLLTIAYRDKIEKVIFLLLLECPEVELNPTLLEAVSKREDTPFLQTLLQHPNIVSLNTVEFLYTHLKEENAFIVQTLFNPDILFLPISVSTFNYAIEQGKFAIVSRFLRAVGVQRKQAFIDQALALAGKEKKPAIVKILNRYSAPRKQATQPILFTTPPANDPQSASAPLSMAEDTATPAIHQAPSLYAKILAQLVNLLGPAVMLLFRILHIAKLAERQEP